MLNITDTGKTYDVIVCGGGPAGIGAALASSGNGQKTLLIENGGTLGGTSTLGNLPMMLGYTTGSVPFPEMLARGLKYSDLPHPRRAVGGVYEKIMRAIAAQQGSLGPMRIPQNDRCPGLDRLGCHDEFIFDIETGKRVLDQMITEAGIDLTLYSRVVGAERKGDRVEGIYTADKSGVRYFRAKTVIDCTGDADVAEQAGFATRKGENGKMAIAGLVAHAEGIDASRIARYLNEGNDPWFRPLCKKAQEENPELPLPSRIILFPMMQDGVFMINGGLSWGGYDGTDADDLTRLTLRGREEAFRIVNVLMKKYFPGCENVRIRSTASYPGIRETRHIVSERGLKEKDILEGTRFEDTVALAGRHFDLQREPGKQTFAAQGMKAALGFTPIPFSALVPAGAENLIAAGRCIDAEGQALGPARIMSTCVATGEAAGTAAAIRNASGTEFSRLDRKLLLEKLAEQDAETGSTGTHEIYNL